MFNIKSKANIENFNLPTKVRFLIYTFVAVLFAFLGIHFHAAEGASSFNITLPQKVSGIEKVEYIINDSPKGSTAGTPFVSTPAGSKINFLIKIESQGYNRLYAKNVKIVSPSGTALSLRVYEYGANNDLITRALNENEIIDPSQTYVSESYNIYHNETFHIEGVTPDIFSAQIRLEGTSYSADEVLDVTYQDSFGKTQSARYSGDKGSYNIENISSGQALKIWINIREAFSDSVPVFFNGSNILKRSTADNSLTIYSITDDITVTVGGISKNTYSLSFAKYDDVIFKYKKSGVETNFETCPNASITASYGDDYLLTLEALNEATLTEKEITANNIALLTDGSVYYLQDIKENTSVAITNKNDVFYRIELPPEEKGIEIQDTLGNTLPNLNVKHGQSTQFKIRAQTGYTQNIGSALIYAVPTSKTSNGDYDVSANPTEAASYLLTPSPAGVFNIPAVNESLSLIVKNLKPNTYKVTMPSSVSGAAYYITPSNYIEQLNSNTYKVEYGKDMDVTVTPMENKSIENINFESSNPDAEILRKENLYTIKNIIADMDIVINNVTEKEFSVTFDCEGAICRNETGNIYEGNKTNILHDTAEIKFSIEAADDYEIEPSGIQIAKKSGDAVIGSTENKGYYTLSSVTSDTVLQITGIKHKDVTIFLSSSDNSVHFKSASSQTLLPEANAVSYGSNFEFQVVDQNGSSLSNVKVIQANQGEIEPISQNSNIYSLPSVTQSTGISASKFSTQNNSSEPQETQPLATQWRIANKISVHSNPLNSCTCSDFSYYDSGTSGDPSGIIGEGDPDINANSGQGIQIIPKYQPYLSKLPGTSTSTESQTYELKFEATIYPNAPYTLSNFKGMKLYTDNSYTLELSGGENQIFHKGSAVSIFTDISNYSKYSPSYSAQDTQCYYVNMTYLVTVPNSVAGSGYVFDSLHFVPEFEKTYSLTDTSLHFYPPLEGASYYNAQIVEQSTAGTVSVNIGEPMESQTYPLANGEEMLFAVKIEEGYEIGDNSLQIYPSNKIFSDSESTPIITLEKLTDVVIEKNYYCYRIKKSYVKDAYVYMNNVNKKTYTAKFSGNGSIYKDVNNDQFLTQHLEHNSDFTFIIDTKEGYENSFSQNGDPNLTVELIVGTARYNLAIPSVQSGSSTVLSHNDTNGVFEGTITTSSSGKITFALKKISGDFTLYTNRKRKQFNINFMFPSGDSCVEYTVLSPSINAKTISAQESITLSYEQSLSFAVNAVEGYDISNIAITANHNVLDFINGKYTITSITENVDIQVENVKTVKSKVTFTQYESVAFKDKSGKALPQQQEIDYNTVLEFRPALSQAYSNSFKSIQIHAEYASGSNATFVESDEESNMQAPHFDSETGLYKINVKENIRIYVTDLEPNKYSVEFIEQEGIKFYEQYETPSTENTNFLKTQEISYGENFSFKVVAQEGYDVSNLKVYDRNNSSTSSQVQLLAADGIYTVTNVCSNHTITVESIKKSECQIEFRTVEGVTCVNDYGEDTGSNVNVWYGESYSFKLSLASAYSNSTPTVTIKGVSTALEPNSSGVYTIDAVKSNLIIEVINITKNSYTATFVPTEGVEYRTAKNKPFSGTQNVEYDSSLYFKVSLLDAYDKSTPWVMLGGEKTLVENGGIYVLENIRDNVEVVVKNVVKNPEEATMEDVNNVPEEITSEKDIDQVVKATQTYLGLTEEQKAQVTNTVSLEEAQQKAGDLNHESKGVSVDGVGWNIKLAVTPLSSNQEKMSEFGAKIERRSLMSLYEIQLIDTLTNKEYEIPYGQQITVTIPAPDLSGYKNAVTVHENTGGNIEYSDIVISGDKAQFETSSFSLFGIAAKKIPNYIENPSEIKISVSSLVESPQELESLLGEGLVSQLGNLIDETDSTSVGSTPGDLANSTSSGDTKYYSTTSDSVSSSTSNNEVSTAQSIIDNVDIKKAYKWAIDNEFICVVAILVIGSSLIWIIIKLGKKQQQNENK